MSRPLRIEFPGAWYHVMNRGRREEPVFREKDDYLTFIDLLKETVEMWNMRVSAYCLIPNHYHLLIQTPDANLSRCIRHINPKRTEECNDLSFEYYSGGQPGGDRPGFQYSSFQFGQQCRGKNEEEDIQQSEVEKTRREIKDSLNMRQE